ncbi:MAG TPA: GntR family transcriptional regulator [Opitutaceae bacterium]|nr:GntR family transcriptional regulator [Opitutaceae bacterium]
MLPFSIEFKLGLPVAEQIIFAVKKAVVSGQMRVGDKFPSVRQLSQELKVNPNTAHKVVAALVDEGVLVTTPAVGSVIAAHTDGDVKDRAALLGAELEKLVVEAKKLGLNIGDVQASLADHWERLGKVQL